MTLFFFSSVGMVKGLETTARELASSAVERGEVDCFKERDGQADASALTLAATNKNIRKITRRAAVPLASLHSGDEIWFSPRAAADTGTPHVSRVTRPVTRVSVSADSSPGFPGTAAD